MQRIIVNDVTESSAAYFSAAGRGRREVSG